MVESDTQAGERPAKRAGNLTLQTALQILQNKEFMSFGV